MITEEILDLDEQRARMIGRQATSKINARGISGRIFVGMIGVVRDVDLHFGEVKVWFSPREDRCVCLILRPESIEVG